MDEYINLPLKKGISSIDFHFYSFFEGTAHEIANYMFEDIEGVLEYSSPTEKDDDGNKIYLDRGKIEFTLESIPARGWYKSGDISDVFKFCSLMDATLCHQNIEQLPVRDTSVDKKPKLYSHFVGIKVKALMPKFADATQTEETVFPGSSIGNIRLFDYNYFREIDADAYNITKEDVEINGLAVAFDNFGFKAVRLPGQTVYQMSGTFYPFAFDVFNGGGNGGN